MAGMIGLLFVFVGHVHIEEEIIRKLICKNSDLENQWEVCI